MPLLVGLKIMMSWSVSAHVPQPQSRHSNIITIYPSNTRHVARFALLTNGELKHINYLSRNGDREVWLGRGKVNVSYTSHSVNLLGRPGMFQCHPMITSLLEQVWLHVHATHNKGRCRMWLIISSKRRQVNAPLADVLCSLDVAVAFAIEPSWNSPSLTTEFAIYINRQHYSSITLVP
jgi:hypothetical protein